MIDLSRICSAKGCTAPSAFALVWNNPRIHPPDREKVWDACETHREHLSAFLGVRGFLRRVEPLEQLEPPTGSAG